MKIFLDTADTELISKYFSTGLVDGVTTNPTLIMKSGRNPEDVYQQIKDIGVPDISMEVMGSDLEMYDEAKILLNDWINKNPADDNAKELLEEILKLESS